MATSTNRPKPKPGQSAGKAPADKQNTEKQTNGNAPKTARTTSGSDTPTLAKTSGASAQTAGKTSGSVQPAAKSSSGSVEPGAKTGAATTKPLAKTSGSTQPTGKTSANPQASAKTTKASGNLKATPKPEPKEKTQPPKQQVTKRDQKRGTRQDEISRRIEERRQQREREQRNRVLKRWGIIGTPILVAVIVVGIILYNTFFGPNVAPYLKGATIDGISCDQLEQSVAHYHAHLAVYVNGQPVSVPQDVGRQTAGCLYWLHTHDGIAGDDGVIHIEAPANKTFELSQFFDIWGQPLNSTSFMGHTLDKTHKLTVYVYNPSQPPTDTSQPFTVTPPSNLTPYTGDPRQIQLKAHELIILEYGTPLVPPAAASFPAGE